MIKHKILILIIFILTITPVYADTEQGGDSIEESQIKTARVPIIMYHRISNSDSAASRFVITPKEFEDDLKFLQNNAYTPVVMKDLISFVEEGTDLPEKPVVITFDDGYYSDYRYSYPLLKQYQMKAVISVIGKFTDEYSRESNQNVNYPHLVWRQISEITADGLIEIQNHSYNLHGSNGSKKLSSESSEEYKTRLKADLEKTQARVTEMAGITPTTFTYPLGKISSESHEVLKGLGIKASLSCTEGINIIKQGEAECLFLLKRCIRPHGLPISKILNKY